MKRPLIAALSAALLACMPALSQAAVVHSDYTLIAGNSWYADFTVVNDGSPAQITGFTIHFDESVFSSLSLVDSPATWNTLLIPTDLQLPAAGFLDSFVIDGADAIGAGQSQGGFRVKFDHIPGGTPPALSFDINDPSFNVLFSGTTLVTAVPEPASVLLAALGLCGVLAAARGQRSRAHRNEEIAA